MVGTARASGAVARRLGGALLAGTASLATPPPAGACDDAAIVANSGELVVVATWDPMVRSKYGFQERWPLLQGLAPAQVERAWTQAELSCFVPPADAVLGEPWPLDRAKLLAIVRQLHAGAQLEMHVPGQHGGGHALLLRRSEAHDVVLARVHVDVRLDERGSWYTPAQLEGTVVVERASGRVAALELALPRFACNVDLNWARGEAKDDGEEAELWVDAHGNVVPRVLIEADIGFVPRLGLESRGFAEADAALADVEWRAWLDREEARRRLARRFYRFAQVDWRPFEEAVAEARESGRPLHVVALFGALGDESC